MDLAARVEHLIADAVTLMQERAGGASVCAMSRAGKPVPGVKYAEGRWAALREVQRAARTRPIEDALAAASATWSASLGRAESTGMGRDWVAYYSGGVDALEEVVG